MQGEQCGSSVTIQAYVGNRVNKRKAGVGEDVSSFLERSQLPHSPHVKT